MKFLESSRAKGKRGKDCLGIPETTVQRYLGKKSGQPDGAKGGMQVTRCNYTTTRWSVPEQRKLILTFLVFED